MRHVRPALRAVAAAAIVSLLLGTAPVEAENWPHWRGPRHDGTSTETGLPTTWSRDDNVRWRLALPGPAASTPVVWGDQLVLTSTRAEGDDLLVIGVGTDGSVQWEVVVPSPGHRARTERLGHETSAASPSPVTDGESVWAFFGSGQLLRLGLDGELIWQTDLFERYGEPSTYFGVATTPLLLDGTLFFQWLHADGQSVIALDAATGEERWRRSRATDASAESLHAYTSPIPVPGAGGPLVLVHGADYLTAHDPRDGLEVWRFGTINPASDYNSAYRLVATPTVAGDVVVVPSAQRGPVFAIRAGGGPGRFGPGHDRVLWELERANPDVPSPLVHEGLVYLSDVKGVLRVVELESGEELFAERVHEVPHRGSPTLADGRIHLIGSDGTVSVVAPGREYRLLAKNELGERLAATPAISGGTIYLRTYDALWAIGADAEAGTDTAP